MSIALFPFLLLFIGCVVLVKTLRDDRKPPAGGSDPAALQRAWDELSQLERRIAELEASVIERCGRRPPAPGEADAAREYAENVTISKSN